jgi:hypothetical protein
MRLLLLPSLRNTIRILLCTTKHSRPSTPTLAVGSRTSPPRRTRRFRRRRRQSRPTPEARSWRGATPCRPGVTLTRSVGGMDRNRNTFVGNGVHGRAKDPESSVPYPLHSLSVAASPSRQRHNPELLRCLRLGRKSHVWSQSEVSVVVNIKRQSLATP